MRAFNKIPIGLVIPRRRPRSVVVPAVPPGIARPDPPRQTAAARPAYYLRQESIQSFIRFRTEKIAR